MTNASIYKQPLYQKLPLATGSSFVVNRYQSPFFETPWHFHEEYELVYCEKGFGKKIVGNSFSHYEEGDMAFIGKNVPHIFKADDSYYQPDATVKPSSIVIQFKEDFLGTAFFNCPEMIEVKKLLEITLSGFAVLGQTKERVKQIMLGMLQAGKIARLNSLIEIFGILSTCEELEPLSANSITGIDVSDSHRMHKILDYALQNYKSHISVSAAAKIAHLSESAFCRYFKGRTQKSFLELVIEMRINEACRLLKETDMPVLEVCYEAGFNNLSNFNRQFRLLTAMAPLEYRNTITRL